MKRFLEKRRDHLEDESGSVIILVAGMLVVMLVAAAFALDFGRVYIVNSKVQTACDVSAMAAVAKYDPTKTGCDKTNNLNAVRDEAKRVMKANGYEINDCDVIINEVDQTVEVKKKVSVDTTFAKIININKLNTSKSAVAGVSERVTTAPKKYSLFSGSETDPILLEGSMHIVGGDVHTNAYINMKHKNSSLDVDENLTSRLESKNVENANQFDVNNKSKHASTVINESIPMPDYDQSIKSRLPKDDTYSSYNSLEEYISTHSYYITENIKVKHVSKQKNADGKYAYSGMVTLAAGKSIIITGDGADSSNEVLSGLVTINDRSSIYNQHSGLEFTNYTYLGPGYVIAKNNISFTGSGIMPTNANSSAALYSENGDVNILPAGQTSSYYGLIYAPKGSFIIPDRYSINVLGSVVANVIGTKGSGSLSVKPLTTTDNSEFIPISDTIGGAGTGGKGTVKTKLVK